MTKVDIIFSAAFIGGKITEFTFHEVYLTRSNTINGENSTLFLTPLISVLLLFGGKSGPGVFLLSVKSRLSTREV